MYKPGITLYDLMKPGDPIESLYGICYREMNPLLVRNIYPVHDNTLFADFISRFCDKFFNRYINYNTYNMMYIKIKFIMENNKLKYQQIYKASLEEIKPLITYSETETIKEDATTTGEGFNITNGSSKNERYGTGEDYTKNTTSFENRENEVTNTPTGEEITETTTDDDKGGIKTVQATTSNPQSNSERQMVTDLSGFKYVDSQQIAQQENNYTVKSKFNNRKDTNTTKLKGKEFTETQFRPEAHYITTDENGVQTSGNTKDIKDSFITRIRNGFNGNQMELIEMYSKMVFDINNAIIEDINNSGVFMKLL